ncbi:YopX family protein [Priestia endophytica]
MKNIKFRAWDSEEKVMHEWHGDFFYDTSPVTRYLGSFDDIPEEMILMQYTNLKDKNDEDIYEGDVLLLTSPTGYYEIRAYGSPVKNAHNELFVVTKSDAGYLVRHVKDYARQLKSTQPFHAPNGFYGGWKPIDNYTFWNSQRSFEIKGNVYENPEFLETIEN